MLPYSTVHHDDGSDEQAVPPTPPTGKRESHAALLDDGGGAAMLVLGRADRGRRRGGVCPGETTPAAAAVALGAPHRGEGRSKGQWQ